MGRTVSVAEGRDRAIGSMKVVTICAISASVTAASISMLCFMVLNQGSDNGLLRGHTEQSYFDAPFQYDKARGIAQSSIQKCATSISPKDENSEAEGIAWLMSFPNSGTTFTLNLIRELTNTTTATNYRLESEMKDGDGERLPDFPPAFPDTADAEKGPFLHVIPQKITYTPKLILTKTHCNGYCFKCMKLLETPRSFLNGCLTSKKRLNQNQTTEFVTYSPDLVKKAVHIFRNPMDNIVSRFHHEGMQQAKSNPNWANIYPNNSDGFRQWCTHLNANRTKIMSSSIHWIDSSLKEAMEGVPCVTEVYRYVQWHNLAFSTTSDLQIPSFVFYYEDYSSRFQEVTEELTNFLGLEQLGEAPKFIDDKEYGDYYTSTDKLAIAKFIKEFATKPTWQILEHYLHGYLTESP